MSTLVHKLQTTVASTSPWPARAKPQYQERLISHTHLYRVRNKRELNAKLKGTTLGDVDDDVDDTLKWIKKSKKREKELAKKRQEELESMDKMFQGDEYTESASHSHLPVPTLLIQLLCDRGLGGPQSQS